MNAIAFTAPAGPLTMSSREIADLVERRHDNVKRTIATLVEKGVISVPQIEETPTRGGGKPLATYHLEKRDTFVVVAQLSPQFTARLVDRWQELEARVATLPDLRDPDVLTGLLLDYAGKVKALTAEAESMREDVAAHERLTKAGGSVCLTDAAKSLGVKRCDLIAWMSRNGWLYRRPGTRDLLGYQSRTQQGVLEHKVTTVIRPDGDERICTQVRVTARGLATLAKSLGDAP